MRLLLDTHIFVWAVTGDDRLPAAVAELITDPANSRTVSVASVWEMSIKAKSGRWTQVAPMLDDIADAAEDLDTFILSIDLDAARTAGQLEWEHRDPFDRMLAAQAQLGRYTLVTVDRQFEHANIDLAI